MRFGGGPSLSWVGNDPLERGGGLRHGTEASLRPVTRAVCRWPEGLGAPASSALSGPWGALRPVQSGFGGRWLGGTVQKSHHFVGVALVLLPQTEGNKWCGTKSTIHIWPSLCRPDLCLCMGEGVCVGNTPMHVWTDGACRSGDAVGWTTHF